ncbi:unnamed protein product [Protopolystoma xenopodis]|uniref:Calmodulin-binding domain-containing protein n=1 Tax=Protopolystoma xenopodis TaxID=117903 RepID=A0A448XRD2_9PLAT|nr:unnamed protein product [Protopolystoma xenopodis]
MRSGAGGIMERLDTTWILAKAGGCEKTESSPATLGLTNMAGVFIMVAAGIVAGVFLIFIEIAYKRRRGVKEKQLRLARAASSRWRTNIEVSRWDADLFRYTAGLDEQSGCNPTNWGRHDCIVCWSGGRRMRPRLGRQLAITVCGIRA